MADVEKDQRDGKEAERASRRSDSRAKEGLVAVKRFGAALEWITKVLEETAKINDQARALGNIVDRVGHSV